MNRPRIGTTPARGRLTPMAVLATALLLSAACATGGGRMGSASAAAPEERLAPGVAQATFDTAWSMLSRTWYDTAFARGRWQAARDSLRPLAAAAPDASTLRRELRALLAVPGASHLVLIPGELVPERPQAPEGTTTRQGNVGAELRLADDTLVVWRVEPDGPAARAGLRPGQRVDALGRVGLDSIRRWLDRTYPGDASTQRHTLLSLAAARMGGALGDSVRLTVEGRERWLAIAAPPGRVTQVGNLPPLSVRTLASSVTREVAGTTRRFAVVGFTAWFPVLAPELDRAVDDARDADGIVIDLRGNPGGIVGMLFGFSGHFLDSTYSLGELRSRDATLRLAANPRRVDTRARAVRPFAGPLAIVVDPMSASTSEFFAAGLQALGRARIVGETSAGQALPSLMERLPNGDVLLHPFADHRDASGRRIEGVGVRPDDLVPLRRADLLAGRDAPLEAALDWLARAPRQR